jgi:copper chaperone CopZ
MRKGIVIGFALALGYASAFVPRWAYACPSCDVPAAASAPAEGAQAKAEGGESVCRLKVDGMTCAACAASVTSAAKGVRGVSVVEVDHKAGTAVVHYERELTDPETIAAAITGAGYRASVSAR